MLENLNRILVLLAHDHQLLFFFLFHILFCLVYYTCILTENKTEFIRGIPDFWLNVLEKVSLVNQMIEESDKPILKHLINIDIDLSEQKPFNFKLKFYFEPNEYFSETVLTKTY